MKTRLKITALSRAEEIAFDRGYAAAVANLICLHGTSTEAYETFMQNFGSLEDAKKNGISHFDTEYLSKLFPRAEDVDDMIINSH